jgi:putative DNA primase/helicase
MTNNIPPTNEVFDQFRDAMVGRGIIPPDDIIADGEIHRCGTREKPTGKNASYLLHLDGIPAGGFQDWSDGLDWKNWHVNIGCPLTPGEKAALQKRAKADQAKRDAERAARNAEVAKKAAGIWEASKPCGEHPYLVEKGVSAHGARIYKDSLVLPVQDVSGALQSLQFIGEDGGKRFLSGGKKHGCLPYW